MHYDNYSNKKSDKARGQWIFEEEEVPLYVRSGRVVTPALPHGLVKNGYHR